MRATWPLVLGALLTVHSDAHSQSQTLGDFNWQLVRDGSGEASISHTSIKVIGPDGFESCAPSGQQLGYSTRAEVAGTVVAALEWFTTDTDTFEIWDFAYFELDGELEVLVSGSTPSTTLLVAREVPAGSTFGFGVKSTDCQAGPGEVWVRHFSFLPGAQGTPELWVDEGEAHDPRLLSAISGSGALGLAVSIPGDLDADGEVDIVGREFSSGAVRAFSSLTGETLWSTLVASGGGGSLAAPGDVNGDGVADVVATHPKLGRVVAHSGADGSLLWTRAFAPSAFAPWPLDIVADLDGDDVDDVIAGTGPASLQTPVHVLSGTDGAVIHALLPSSGDNGFGKALARAGDVDGDGTEDLLVGAPDPPSRVRVFSGATGEAILLIEPESSASVFDFGASVASAGDLDGDGLAEILVAAPFEAISVAGESGAPLIDAGSISVIRGADGALLHKINGEESFASLGARLHRSTLLDSRGTKGFVAASLTQAGARGRLSAFDPLTGATLATVDAPTGVSFTDSGVSRDGVTRLAAGTAFDSLGGSISLWRNLLWPRGMTLSGDGQPLGGSVSTLRVSDGPARGFGYLVVGVRPIHMDFRGGVLVPAPDQILAIAFDNEGAFELSVDVPQGIGVGEPFWIQAWTSVPDASADWASSNALRTVEFVSG